MTTIIACGTSKQTCETTDHYHERPKIEIVADLMNPDSTNTILIEGHIFDKIDLQPLIGVNFIVDETKIGSVTDIDGKFTLSVEKSKIKAKTVSVQYLGFETIQIPIMDIRNKIINIEMVESDALLGEIVIIKVPIHKRIWNGIKNIFR